MNVRLVAYRPATTTATVDTTYELELQEAPNVSLNFQFSDIKEPETRKGSYSQTFKLPFTDNNNKFFQDWYNVNASTLVFDTRKSFDAVLFADGVSQFEGIIQLKAVYKKAQFYQVVLLSNTADLFTVIGSNKLKDVFLNDNGTYSEELDHTFTAANVAASWDGSDSGFQNIAGTSLRDTDVNVQKVMYPMSFTIGNAYYNIDVAEYLNASSLTADDSNLQVPITQLRPAIQIKELFRLIIAKAGFSYTSSFIDGD